MTTQNADALHKDAEAYSDPAQVTLSSPKFRIMHVVSSLEIGGAEQFVLRIARFQKDHGHDVMILSIRQGPLLETAQNNGIRVQVIDSGHKSIRVLRTLLAMARERPQITHAHNVHALKFAVLAKIACRTRIIMTDHGHGMGLVRKPSRWEWEATDAVVPVGVDVLHRRKISEIVAKSHVIVNAVEDVPAERTREAVRAELGIPLERPVCIIASRIDGRKGHDTLIEATAILRDRGVPMTLVVAGDGPEKETYQRLAQEQDLCSEWVQFLGFRFDVPDLLAASDFYGQPSITEGIALSFLEAMWHSLPVIATPVGGTPEVVEDGETGILVTLKDANNLANVFQQMIQDTDLRRRLGTNGKRRVSEDFRFDQMVLKYHSLYAKLCNAGNRSGN